MLLKKIELKKDFYTHSFNKEISNILFKILRDKTCKFCRGKLDPNKTEYYQHNGGWQTSIIKEKIWIWFTCPQCGHQWSINHLGVSRDKVIDLIRLSQLSEEHIIHRCSKCNGKIEEYDVVIEGKERKMRNYKQSLSFALTAEGMVCFKCLNNN